jgi:hypothetical protein
MRNSRHRHDFGDEAALGPIQVTEIPRVVAGVDGVVETGPFGYEALLQIFEAAVAHPKHEPSVSDEVRRERKDWSGQGRTHEDGEQRIIALIWLVRDFMAAMFL